MKCERCDLDISEDMTRKQFVDISLCMTCLFLIVKEWNIKKKEINFLGQGRIFCESRNSSLHCKGKLRTGITFSCIYEVNHIGRHSWEI